MALSEPSVDTENETKADEIQNGESVEAERTITEVPDLMDSPPSLASTVDGIESNLSMRVKKRNGDLEEV
ncbi:MAG: hypothetical protein VYA88_03270, partial [Actinomycetota bacterium]|nr:hypothetical protein [Actinomycetota bacterium]